MGHYINISPSIFYQMFVINSMQVLYKQAALMQSLVTHNSKIKLTVNGGETFLSQEVPVKEKLAIWNQSQSFPTIKLDKTSHTILLEFFFIKNNQQVGRAKCTILFGKNRKDCLDIANLNYQIVGKFLYTAYWKINENNQLASYPTQINYNIERQDTYCKGMQKVKEDSKIYYPQGNQYPEIKSIYNNQKSYGSEYKAPDLSKPYFTHSQMSQIKKEQTKKPPVQNSIFTAWLFSGGCFGKRKLKKSRAFFAIEPLVIELNELPYASPMQEQPFPIQYYTKKIEEKYSG